MPAYPELLPPVNSYSSELEEVGSGETPQIQVNMREKSLKDRTMICITVILFNLIFRCFITARNSIWAVLATLGTVCSSSLNFVCKPAIVRCLRTNSRVSAKREAKNRRGGKNRGITCGLAAGRAVIWVALLVSCARSALGRPGRELTRSLSSTSRRRSSCCLKSTDDTLCWLKHACFMFGSCLNGIVNFVCTPAIERCLGTPNRGFRSLSSQRRRSSNPLGRDLRLVTG